MSKATYHNTPPGTEVVVLRGYQKDRYGRVARKHQHSLFSRYVLLDGSKEAEEFLISDLGVCEQGEKEEEEDVTFLEVKLRVRTTRGDVVHVEKRSFEIETEQIVITEYAADMFAEAIAAKASEHGIELPKKP